jgi:hypothetical protein
MPTTYAARRPGCAPRVGHVFGYTRPPKDGQPGQSPGEVSRLDRRHDRGPDDVEKALVEEPAPSTSSPVSQLPPTLEVSPARPSAGGEE